MCGFLQGDSYSPVYLKFCIPRIPVYKLLQEYKAYRMGQPRKRVVKRIYSLFVNDLKVCQESQKNLERRKRDDCTG